MSRARADAQIEARASGLLRRYALLTGWQPSLPVPVEDLAENLCDLGLLWEPIDEPSGQIIFAELRPDLRAILYNERRRHIIDGTPHLYRTATAHEIGHWTLHVQRDTLEHPRMNVGTHARSIAYQGTVESSSWQEKEAKSFSRHLLMPRDLVAPIVAGKTFTNFPAMYSLRDQCEVTVTMAQVYLSRMNAAYVDEHERIHGSREESKGQKRLF